MILIAKIFSSIICSTNIYLLSAYYIPGTILHTGNRSKIKYNITHCLHADYISVVGDWKSITKSRLLMCYMISAVEETTQVKAGMKYCGKGIDHENFHWPNGDISKPCRLL